MGGCGPLAYLCTLDEQPGMFHMVHGCMDVSRDCTGMKSWLSTGDDMHCVRMEAAGGGLPWLECRALCADGQNVFFICSSKMGEPMVGSWTVDDSVVLFRTYVISPTWGVRECVSSPPALAHWRRRRRLVIGPPSTAAGRVEAEGGACLGRAVTVAAGRAAARFGA